MEKIILNLRGKILLNTTAILFLSVHFSYAQEKNVKAYLQRLPEELELVEKSPQRYRVTTDYFNGDIFGNFFNKTRVTGEYTRGLKNGVVKWNDVKMANGTTREGAFDDPVKLNYMEDFSYVPSEKLMETSSFADFPTNSFQAKNLIWDMMAIETFAWLYFDSLRLNQTYRPEAMNGVVPLAGQGTFENRDIQLRWIGISEMRQEICALIEYRTMDNPLVITAEQLSLKGRSHYWGTIWVSLEDKQIEYAELYEDVVMKMKIGDQPEDQLMNTTRTIVFEKIN